ncbi:hypothetical protein B0G81_0566 [Paraburkholderia sp. BL6665CI2N2]|uniref:methyltransferase type 11 n=1 Tax=Paraburkholderia sp. BL6665CI2N2 TaxID=1938806 RepID=UPI0010663BE7|nr:methyltransferase type 11 [Paraburkholderia sp. BL6665CI2N2]TDY20408.1 hypothetical protein B0G81_0566 [Paraburkholderia sp. BL6665CI2N2]
MNPSLKLAQRRSQDPAFLQGYFSGVGLDMGAGRDSDFGYADLFPRIEQLIAWNVNERDVIYMDDAPADVFDFVHSDCLGRFANPHQVLARWLELIKPGGYLILTLPTDSRGEEIISPTLTDVDHERTFTPHRPDLAIAGSANALDLVNDASAVSSCERFCVLCEFGENRHEGFADRQHQAAAYAIEIVLRKRDVPRLFDLATAMPSAETDSAMLDLCQETLRLYPYRLQTYFHINLELVRRGLCDQLEDLWDEGVRRLPNERLPRLFNALMLIALGKLTEGFRRREALFDGSDWRGRTTVAPPAYANWRGESLEGKSIVIWSEFGLGDEIFFFRFARIFRERYGTVRVTVVCQAPLVELFRASGEAAAICCVEDAPLLPIHDYWVYPHAIPVWASLDIDHLPDVVPYLRAGVAHTPMALPGNLQALKVGVIFKGAPTHENDAARSLPSLSCLDPLFALEDVEFYIMQKGQGEDEAADYAMRLRNVHDLGPGLRSFGDTAKLMDALDLVISVDTSAANLAGAMGRPLWLMLPMLGDWRWHLEREDSPWFPSARLFREQGRGWPEVVERIRLALIELRNTR